MQYEVFNYFHIFPSPLPLDNSATLPCSAAYVTFISYDILYSSDELRTLKPGGLIEIERLQEEKQEDEKMKSEHFLDLDLDLEVVVC